MASGPLISWDIFMRHYHERMALADDAQHLKMLSRTNCWKFKWDPMQILLQQGKVIIVTDPLLKIIFASRNLTEMNGYHTEEVIGNTPKMFQGPATSDTDRAAIRQAISKRASYSGTIDNHRKSGSIYKCQIEILPAFNQKMDLVHFVAYERILHD